MKGILSVVYSPAAAEYCSISAYPALSRVVPYLTALPVFPGTRVCEEWVITQDVAHFESACDSLKG